MKSHALRSRQGCWTCRLRKKKCDESRPNCEVCKSLQLTCHGYGPKPEWMKDEIQQQAVINQLKNAVRQNAKRRPRARAERGEKPNVKILPRQEKVADMDSDDSSSSIASGERNLAARPRRIEDSSSQTQPAVERSGNQKFQATRYNLSPRDSIFLMYYIDQTFPLLYPMYRPHPYEGGRGWLLQLLLRSESLFQAALAIGSYHNYLDRFQESSDDRECRMAARVQHHERLDACLQSIKRSFTEISRLDEVQTNQFDLVASMVQMVFLELFTDDTRSWQIHLAAAIEVFEKVCVDQVSALSRRLGPIVCSRDEDESVTGQDIMTFRILASTLVWLGLLSAMSNGTAPRSSLLHLAEKYDANIRMSYMVGCESWVVFQISCITEVYEQSTNGSIDQSRASDIASKLRNGLDKLQQQAAKIDRDTHDNQNDYLLNVTSTIFAYAAGVYLQLVFPELKDSFLEDLDRPLRMIERNLDIVGSVIGWPLFIFGCVARGVDQDSIRKAYNSPRVTNPANPLQQKRRKILLILEDLWLKRLFTWTIPQWSGITNLIYGHILY